MKLSREITWIRSEILEGPSIKTGRISLSFRNLISADDPDKSPN